MRNMKQTAKIDGYPRQAVNGIRREATVFELIPINRYGLGMLRAAAAVLLMRGTGLMPHFRFRSSITPAFEPASEFEP